MFSVLLLCAASASAAGLSPTDRSFLAHAVRGNNYEIQAAHLALRLSRDGAVRDYAQMMLNDHRKLGQQVEAAVARTDAGLKLPVTVTYRQADLLQELRQARHFDRTYRSQMLNSHNETYQLFDQYSRSRSADAGLQRVIRAARPTVQMHWNGALRLPR